MLAEYPQLMIRHGIAVFRTEYGSCMSQAGLTCHSEEAAVRIMEEAGKIVNAQYEHLFYSTLIQMQARLRVTHFMYLKSAQEKTGRWIGMYHTALKLLEMKASNTIGTYNRLCLLSLMDVWCSRPSSVMSLACSFNVRIGYIR